MRVERRYLHDINLVNNRLLNPVINPMTTAQRTTLGALLTVADQGYTTYDTDLNALYFWNGSSWITTVGIATWGSITGTITAQTDLTTYLSTNYYPLSSNPAGYITSAALAPYLTTALAAATYVPLTRNITINGQTYDLSADRSWTVSGLPSQSGNNGKWLTTDGTTASWATLPSIGGTLVALPFTTDHITATGNPYLIGDVVYYNGDVYRCIANNDSILPTNASYWTNLGTGFPLVQQPGDWNSTSGNNQILNKPTIPTVTPSALTKIDDTNVTLTLGGTPNTALLQSVSLTLGWTGTLADSRIASAATWNSKEPGITAGTTAQYWRGDKTWQTLDKSAVGLSNVENTALSTWAGSTNLTTLGTIGTGVWNGTAIGDTYISSASTWNNKQNAYTNLTTIGLLANATGYLYNDGSGVFSYTSPSGAGTVTSVGLSMPSAFTVSSSPVTGAGTLTVTGAGTTSDYIDGTGALQSFPTTSSTVTTDNVLYVAKNGNDSTGTRNELTKPYLTIQAAVTAASSGDMVYVYPGTYTESIILKDGVNIYLNDGVTIQSSTSYVISDNNVAVTCIVDGYGRLINTGTSSNKNVIYIVNSGSDITIRAKYVESSGSSGACLYMINGTVRYEVTLTYGKLGGGLQAVYADNGTLYFKGEAWTDLDYTILISGATAYIDGVLRAKSIGTFGNSALEVAGNGYIDFTGYAVSDKLYGFEMAGGYAYLHNATLESKSTGLNGSAISYYGGNLLELDNVILKCSDAAAKSLETQGVSNKIVKVYTSSYATNAYQTTPAINFSFGKQNLLVSGTNIAHASLDTNSKLVLDQVAYNTPTNGQIVSYNSGTNRAEWTTPSSGGLLHGTASGTDTYTVTIAGPTSYADGDAYLIRFTIGNTGTSTLNINGIGAIPLYRNNDGPLLGGDIVDGAEMLCVYNSGTNRFQTIGVAPNTLIAYVTNDDSVTITKGQPVYAFSGTGDRMTVKLAYNTGDATSAQTVGLVFSSSIAAGQKGLIMVQGLLDGLSTLPTSTWNDGDPVYLGATAGTITKVKPYAPNHLVYLGVVTTASPGSAGRMYVRVQNGYELDELHNVQAQSPSLKDTLWYDSSVSPGQWKTASISTILGYTPANASGTINELAYFTGSTTLASLSTSTYPSLTELSYVKGVTSGIQSQLNSKISSQWTTTGTAIYYTTGNVLAGSSTDDGVNRLQVTGDAIVSGVLKETVTLSAQSASYQLVLGDRGKLVTMSVGSANNLTVPDNGTVAFPVGTKIDVIQIGAGITTIVAGGSTVLRSNNSALRLNGQYAACTLIKVASDEWYVIGNLVN